MLGWGRYGRDNGREKGAKKEYVKWRNEGKMGWVLMEVRDFFFCYEG